MRVSCDSCGAKYSIPDERVKYQAFKFRCKKCGHVIIVDYIHGLAGMSSEAIWYVMLKDEQTDQDVQTGPITAEDVERYMESGQIIADTFVWRDGLDDWVPLHSLEEFGHLIGAAEALGLDDIEPSEGGDFEATRQVNVQDVFGESFQQSGFDGAESNPLEQDDDFGETRVVSMDYVEEGLRSVGSAQSSSASSDGGLGSFGGGGGGLDLASSSPQPDPAPSIFDSLDDDPADDDPRRDANDLVGARSENSVLFSLNNLRAISDGPAEQVASSTPTTEGSGLIDIKALAASRASAAPGDGRKTIDDGDGFDAAAMPIAPTMMPMGTRKSNTGLIAGIAVGAVIIIGLLVAVLVLVVFKEDKPQQQQTQQGVDTKKQEQQVQQNPAVAAQQNPAGQNPATVAAATPQPNTAQPKGAQPDGTQGANAAQPNGTQPAGTGAGSGDAATPPDGKGEGDANKAGDGSGEGEGSEGTADAGAEGDNKEAKDVKEEKELTPEEKKEKAERRRKRKEAAAAKKKADEAAAKKKAEEERKKAAAAKKKEEAKSGGGGGSLSKAQVNGVVRRNFGKIRACSSAASSKGKMVVKFQIKTDGRVTGVSIQTAKFKGTPAGTCVAKVVKGMRFPAHGNSNLVIKYPFSIN